jgi:hypothetical protein
MVTPPEVFSGVSWPLEFTEADVDALERASYLDNLKPRHELIEKSPGIRLMTGNDGPFSEEDLEALQHITVQCSPYEQVARSLEAITTISEEACNEIVIAGLADYVKSLKISRSARFALRPNTQLQRDSILRVPFENLDTLESFFAAVSLLVTTGTNRLVEVTATDAGLSVPEVDRQLGLINDEQGMDWFNAWKSLEQWGNRSGL